MLLVRFHVLDDFVFDLIELPWGPQGLFAE